MYDILCNGCNRCQCNLFVHWILCTIVHCTLHHNFTIQSPGALFLSAHPTYQLLINVISKMVIELSHGSGNKYFCICCCISLIINGTYNWPINAKLGAKVLVIFYFTTFRVCCYVLVLPNFCVSGYLKINLK